MSGTQVTLQGTLFGNNEPGFTFEPWDITTLYQDRAGTTPVTAAGQSVGLRLSKDQGLRLGPELVTNGSNEAGVAVAPLDTLTNFTSKVQSADRAQSGTYSAKLTANSTSGSHYWNLTSVAAGVTVQISGWVYVPTGATAGQSIKLVDIFDGSFVPVIATTFDQWVYFSAIRPAKASAWALALGQDTAANWAGGSIYVDGLSIKTLAGNHEVAVSDAKRGVYGWMPKTGRRNLLTYTEQFDNAAWSKELSSVTANFADAPDGTISADRFVSAGGSFPQIFQAATLSAGATYTFSIWVKSDGTSQIAQILILDGAATSFTPNSTWTRVSVTKTGTSGGLKAAVVATNSSTAPPSSFLVWGAQLEPGSTATAYQRVVSQYDITEAGVPTCYYVQADGVDDAYVTPTITPNTDKVQVFAGVRKLSDAATGVIIEHSATLNSNNGSFFLLAPNANASTSSVFSSKGSLPAFGSGAVADLTAAPISKLVSGLGDISADTSTIRVNGTQVAQSTSDQGTGNFLAYPAYIYSRAGTSLPFNGLDFGHAVRFGPNLDAATIARVEALIARNTPEVTL